MAGSGTKFGLDFNSHLLVGGNARHNAGVASFIRVFVALLGGIVTGITGITGWSGFGVFLGMELLGGAVLLAKCGFQPKRYFQGWQGALVDHVFTSVTLLTFILFWTVTNNIIYLF